jgi:hypothetical protein
VSKSLPSNIVTPNIDLERRAFTAQLVATGFSPPNIMDKFLYVSINNSAPQSFSKIYDQVAAFCAKNNLDIWLNELQKSPVFSLATSLFEAATTPGTMFAYVGSDDVKDVMTKPPPKQDILFLHTRPGSAQERFKVGSSISHVDQVDYTQTPEFLMRPISTSGKTLDMLIKEVGSLFGPQTLKLFAKMGYPIANSSLSGLDPDSIINKRQITCSGGGVHREVNMQNTLSPTNVVGMLASLGLVLSCL